MTDSLRQVRELSVLMVRYFQRRAVKAGANPSHTKVPAFLLMSFVSALYFGTLLWRACDRAAQAELDPMDRIGWQLGGILLTLTGLGLAELAPQVGRIRSPLRATLLDELPVTAAARVVLCWIRNPFFLAVPIVASLAWAPERRHDAAAVALIAALGVLIFLAATTTGYAAATWARVAFAARGRRVIGVVSMFMTFGGFAVVVAISEFPRLLSPGGWLVSLAAAIVQGRGAPAAIGVLVAWCVAGFGAIALGELRGYDRLDAAPASVRKPIQGRLTFLRVERLLARREGGLVLLVVQWVVLAAVTAGAVVALMHRVPPKAMLQAAQGYGFLVAYFGSLVALNLAGAVARRDAGARPLLAALPLSPFETLQYKVRVLRRMLLPLFLTALPLVVVTLRWAHELGLDGVATVAWRASSSLVAVWLAADAAVSIAFLTSGVGMPGMQSLGASTSLAPQLLFLPLFATAFAPNVFVMLGALASVAAITFEARRAAGRCVRWLDDPADDAERETTVWRALLAFAVFFAVQALGAQLLGLGRALGGASFAIIYTVASVVLVALTLHGRKRAAPLRFWPAERIALPLGIVAGCVSAFAALGFARLLRLEGASSELTTSAVDRALLVGALTVVAPIAEEIFFRGWLQGAIAADLPPHRRRYAFGIAAIAFAFAHVGGYVVPQLVLGLFAGALFAWSGGLLPGLLAHAVHNTIVVLLGS